MHTLKQGDRIRWTDGLETVVSSVSSSLPYVILSVTYDGEHPKQRFLRFAWTNDPETKQALVAAGIPTENLAGSFELIPKRKNLRASLTLDETIDSHRSAEVA